MGVYARNMYSYHFFYNKFKFSRIKLVLLLSRKWNFGFHKACDIRITRATSLSQEGWEILQWSQTHVLPYITIQSYAIAALKRDFSIPRTSKDSLYPCAYLRMFYPLRSFLWIILMFEGSRRSVQEKTQDVRKRDRGSTVVKVLLYKSEGRWFDLRCCHWNFSSI
jgi:hypothetical protein